MGTSVGHDPTTQSTAHRAGRSVSVCRVRSDAQVISLRHIEMSCFVCLAASLTHVVTLVYAVSSGWGWAGENLVVMCSAWHTALLKEEVPDYCSLIYK